MIFNGDVPSALKMELLRYYGESDISYADTKFQKFFEMIKDGRQWVKIGRMWGTGAWTSQQKGQAFPNRKPFEGAETTITPVPLGEEQSWNFQTVMEVLAAGHDIKKAAQNMAQMYPVSKDQQCADFIRANAAIYDGQAMFATAHPRRSVTLDGGTFDNTLIPSANVGITDAIMKQAVAQMAETNNIGENGEKINNRPNVVICSKFRQSLEADGVLHSVGPAGEISNTKNTIGQYLDQVEWWERLWYSGDTYTYWYLLKAMAPNGLAYQDQVELMVDAWQEHNPPVQKTLSWFAGAPGIGDWRCILRVKDLTPA